MSTSPIVTYGFGSFGGLNLVPTHGYGSAALTETLADDNLLGGKAYSFLTPYQKLQTARNDAVEVKAAIDHAAIEKAALQAKLEKAIQSKAKKQAETQHKLEQKLLQLEAETLRLITTLQLLEALIREWDEEDALLVLAMSNPFLTLKL